MDAAIDTQQMAGQIMALLLAAMQGSPAPLSSAQADVLAIIMIPALVEMLDQTVARQAMHEQRLADIENTIRGH